jgi:ribosomal protein L9
MQVILIQDVDNLGAVNELVSVKNLGAHYYSSENGWKLVLQHEVLEGKDEAKEERRKCWREINSVIAAV